MKVIGIQPGRYSSDPPVGMLVELTPAELVRIIGETKSHVERYVTTGSTVNICQRYDHAMDVLRAAGEAKKLPSALRAFADTLETLHPAIADIEEPVIDASFEVTP